MIRLAIVDDNQPLLQSLLERIEKFDDLKLVLTAPQGKACLQKLSELPKNQLPEVILMDIEMDTLDGIETTEKVKALYPHIEVVMLTVFDNDAKIFEAIKAGASGYILKDETVEKIYEAVMEVKNGGAQLSPSIARKAISFMKNMTPPTPKDAIENQLTPREIEILELVVEGIPYPQVGEILHISYGTVRTHVKNIFEKLQVKNKQEATKLATQKKWFWKW